VSGAGPITGIDHVLVGVRDLEAARRTFAHLGFTLSPRGRHIGWGTANYCVMLRTGYIELLGIVDPAQFTNNLDRFLEGGEGLLGLAFATDDADAAAQDLQSKGIAVEGPKALSRKLELPGGDVEPAFRLVHPAPEATAGIAAFVCQHLTPELVWQEPWLDHPNGAQGLAAVTVAVADPGDAALAFGTLFGPDAVSAGRGAVEVETGAGILRLTAPDGLAALFPGIANIPTRALPRPAGLRVRVANIEATARYLDQAGVPAIRDGDRLLRLDPARACGVLLEFEGD
jgi:catechol 2,3-dioxygenase-like lactoylglutathione lyase family enzyme